jgi:hypothetical protein
VGSEGCDAKEKTQRKAFGFKDSKKNADRKSPTATSILRRAIMHFAVICDRRLAVL